MARFNLSLRKVLVITMLPSFNLSTKSMFVGKILTVIVTLLLISMTLLLGNDFDQDNNEITYTCEYKDIYSKTSNLASWAFLPLAVQPQTNTSLSLSKVYSVFYAHRTSVTGSSTAYLNFTTPIILQIIRTKISTSLSNYRTLGGISILGSLSAVEKFTLTSSNSSSIYPKALYFITKILPLILVTAPISLGMTFDSNNVSVLLVHQQNKISIGFRHGNNGTSKKDPSSHLHHLKPHFF